MNHFTFRPELNKKEVMALFDLDFIGRQENVIFLGPPNVGKTHLAISLATKACHHHEFKVYFTTMDALMKKRRKTHPRHKAYLTSAMVVVDEVGYLPIDSRPGGVSVLSVDFQSL